jgi:hypothetical protein
MDTDLISCKSIKVNLNKLNESDRNDSKKRGKWSEDEVINNNIGLIT